MRALVVGLGTQGYKRRRFAGGDYVASVDPVNADADYRAIDDVALDTFDAALCCVPDEPKYELLSYLLRHGKHVLVEKPLGIMDPARIAEIEGLARRNDVVCYTAYNHRFEPHFIAMRDLLASGELGQVYSCRLFYGNGTARLVRDSLWRDAGAGVWPDLGSHLLDTCRFWFPELDDRFEIVSCNRFENRAPDHVVVKGQGALRIELEMTLLSWRNSFSCDILAERGSAHIDSLCKWGPSTFTQRRRVLPSGYPSEARAVLVQDDPTWAAEHAHFKRICETGGRTSLDNDLWLASRLAALSAEMTATAGSAT